MTPLKIVWHCTSSAVPVTRDLRLWSMAGLGQGYAGNDCYVQVETQDEYPFNDNYNLPDFGEFFPSELVLGGVCISKH